MAGAGKLRLGALLLLKIAVAFAFIFGFPAGRLLWAQDSAQKITVSPMPISSEQLAIYRVVLASWMGNRRGTHSVHLAIRTMPFVLSEMDADCGKALRMTEGAVNEVHQFQPADIQKLAPSRVDLVDPDTQAKEVAGNDPHTNIRKGRSIGDAVGNAFAHGLTQLGEIHFNHEHTQAIVTYDFSCGATCGNGATVILEKKGGVWRISGRCSVSVA
jgi:hypothetical protein